MTGSSISLVRAGLDDHDTLSAMHGLCFASAWSAQEFTGLLAPSNSYALLARNNGPTSPACGFIVLRHAADEAEIITLGVIPQAQRQGVASAMLASTIAALETDGIACLFLEVAEDNAAAYGFYQSHGFCEVGRRDAYYTVADGTRRTAIVMRRTLSSGSRCTACAGPL